MSGAGGIVFVLPLRVKPWTGRNPCLTCSRGVSKPIPLCKFGIWMGFKLRKIHYLGRRGVSGHHLCLAFPHVWSSLPHWTLKLWLWGCWTCKRFKQLNVSLWMSEYAKESLLSQHWSPEQQICWYCYSLSFSTPFLLVLAHSDYKKKWSHCSGRRVSRAAPLCRKCWQRTSKLQCRLLMVMSPNHKFVLSCLVEPHRRGLPEPLCR